MRYQVSPADLSREVDDLGSALADLDGVRVSMTLGALGPALAGSVTTASLTRLCDTWDAALRETRSSLRSLGEGLAAALAGYEQVEALARRSFVAGPSAATGGPEHSPRTGRPPAGAAP